MAEAAAAGSPETKRISSTGSQPSSETRTRVARARDEAPAKSHDGPPRYVMSQNTFPTTHALSHSLNVDGSQILRDSDTGQDSIAKDAKPTAWGSHQRQPGSETQAGSRQAAYASRAAPTDATYPPRSAGSQTPSTSESKSTSTARSRLKMRPSPSRSNRSSGTRSLL